MLERIDPDGPTAAQEQAALDAARSAVATAGGFAAQYNDIDKVTAHHGDNHVPLVARHLRNDRAAMLAMVGALGLEATSADHSVLDLLEHVRAHAALTRDYIPDHIVVADQAGNSLLDEHGKPRVRVFDTSFASEQGDPGPQAAGHVRPPTLGGVRPDVSGRGTAYRGRGCRRGPVLRQLG